MPNSDFDPKHARELANNYLLNHHSGWLIVTTLVAACDAVDVARKSADYMYKAFSRTSDEADELRRQLATAREALENIECNCPERHDVTNPYCNTIIALAKMGVKQDD